MQLLKRPSQLQTAAVSRILVWVLIPFPFQLIRLLLRVIYPGARRMGWLSHFERKMRAPEVD
jgi:hypothetical protein